MAAVIFGLGSIVAAGILVELEGDDRNRVVRTANDNRSGTTVIVGQQIPRVYPAADPGKSDIAPGVACRAAENSYIRTSGNGRHDAVMGAGTRPHIQIGRNLCRPNLRRSRHSSHYGEYRCKHANQIFHRLLRHFFRAWRAA